MAKILLVEDNEANRDVIAEHLELRGYQVVVAINGDQGVTMAQSEKPDLIIMDMSMPVMDGWEATRRLKTSAETCAIPIIALTAHVMSDEREKCLTAGCDDYEMKPVHFDHLLTKIRLFLDRQTL